MNLSMQQVAPWIALVFAIAASFFLSAQHQHELQNVRKELQELKGGLFQEHHRNNLVSEQNLHTRNNYSTRSQTRYLEVKGVVGDGVADDTRAIQKAINKARRGVLGGTVVLPKGIFLVTKGLKLKAGVTLKGQGYGPSPLNIDASKGGSTLAHCGSDHALKIVGHSASVENLAVTDWDYGELMCDH